ncbi:hypothetical protein F7R20_17625 [Pseudomonas brassicacearum subsp. brassicacearum]|nr:hypothetical protein F7R20_17625 [Pseudomonas brassicacearum subsp. brassicacearum]PJH87673.1 hypothetical protein CVG87_18000 [Pseudomonas sp. WCS365]QEO79491.1 hypothetical protein ELZ14_18705 [Pseudomonas brassicacearum]
MGASLLAMAVDQLASMLNLPTPSRASSLPQLLQDGSRVQCRNNLRNGISSLRTGDLMTM